MGNNNYTIELDHDNKLIRYKHSGKVKQGDIGEVWDKFLELKEFTEYGYNLVSDYRYASFIIKKDDIKIISNILHDLKDIVNGKKQALIMSSPLNTALSMLFVQSVMKKVGFKLKVFSTEEAAIRWITK